MENSEICKACKGICCKTSPGICFPDDFDKEGKPSLEEAMASYNYCFDYWEDDREETSFFVRPAEKGHDKELIHASWGGECAFLSKQGCLLKHDARPTQCRELIPVDSTGNDCRMSDEKYSKENAAIAWRPHYERIIKIIDERENILNG